MLDDDEPPGSPWQQPIFWFMITLLLLALFFTGAVVHADSNVCAARGVPHVDTIIKRAERLEASRTVGRVVVRLLPSNPRRSAAIVTIPESPKGAAVIAVFGQDGCITQMTSISRYMAILLTPEGTHDALFPKEMRP